MSSGVDGASEGGRVSSIRQPTTLMLYAVPLIKRIKKAGYPGALDAEPVLVDGSWALRLTYDGESPGAAVPRLWHGHRVLVEGAARTIG